MTGIFYGELICAVLLVWCGLAAWGENTESGRRFTAWLDRWF